MSATGIVKVFLMGIEWIAYGVVIVMVATFALAIINSMYQSFLSYMGEKEIDCSHRGCKHSDRAGYPSPHDSHSVECTEVRFGNIINFIAVFIFLSLMVGGIRLLL